jgi:hypothetical protein
MLADALRTSGGAWKRFGPEDPFLPKFRELWNREGQIDEQWAVQAGKLHRALQQNFPEAASWFDWDDRTGWLFALEFPGAAILRRAKRHRVEKFLKTNHMTESGVAEKCLELHARLQTARDPAGNSAAESMVRNFAEETVKMWSELGTAQYVGAAILRAHPDYAYFGGTPPPAAEAPVAPMG